MNKLGLVKAVAKVKPETPAVRIRAKRKRQDKGAHVRKISRTTPPASSSKEDEIEEDEDDFPQIDEAMVRSTRDFSLSV